MPPKPPKNDSYIEFILEQLAPMGEVSARRMMGGHTLYCDGVVFALIARGALYLKADDENQGMFDARGLPAFRPDEDKPGTMSYYLAPAEALENREELVHWVSAALAAGRRAAQKRPRKKKPS